MESVFFVMALSTDALIASIAYGSNKIKINFLSIQVIACICTGMLGISLLVGTFLKPYIPGVLLQAISFTILFLLGLSKIMNHIIKSVIDKYSFHNRQIKFSMFNLNFILNVYANPKEADLDQSQTISPKEAFSLGMALSIDNLAAGVGAAFGNVNIAAAIICTFLLSMLAIKSGELIGYKLSEKVPFQISWLGGLLLIILAFLRLK
jgi:putative sporulation protein YtaF